MSDQDRPTNEPRGEDRHTMRVSLTDGYLSLTVQCPYDLADESRPCWPVDRSGEQTFADRAAPQPCNYYEWADALSPDEFLTGDWSVEVAATWAWTDDGPTVTLGELA